MDKLIKTEELAQFIIAAVLLYFQPISFTWWLWPILFFLPDISMIGYAVNTKVGAITYNLFHHKLIALVIIGLGYFLHTDITMLIGLIMYAHSSFDRALGYGLKYPDSFHHTSMGWIGQMSGAPKTKSAIVD